MMPPAMPEPDDAPIFCPRADALGQQPNIPMLDTTDIQRYHRDGYLVLPGFKSADALAAVSARARAIVDAFEPPAHDAPQAAVFSSVEPSRMGDAALLASAAEVHCFFEEEAFDAQGRLRQAKALSINKIGHALHDRDAAFSAFSRDPRMAAIAASIGIEQPQLWQSTVIFKQPAIGGEVRWHQDASYFVTTPHSVTAFWFALEDATRDNGCLWVQPGGHRSPLREVFGRSAQGLALRKLDTTPWPQAGDADTLPLEVSAGTLIVFNGLLPHASAPNRSARSRMAYTLHITDGRSVYAAENWLQRGAEAPVRGFDVGG
jgi:phytanoyl-CoA hydroxylase